MKDDEDVEVSGDTTGRGRGSDEKPKTDCAILTVAEEFFLLLEGRPAAEGTPTVATG